MNVKNWWYPSWCNAQCDRTIMRVGALRNISQLNEDAGVAERKEKKIKRIKPMEKKWRTGKENN